MTRNFAMQSHFDGHTPPFWSELNTVAVMLLLKVLKSGSPKRIDSVA